MVKGRPHAYILYGYCLQIGTGVLFLATSCLLYTDTVPLIYETNVSFRLSLQMKALGWSNTANKFCKHCGDPSWSYFLTKFGTYMATVFNTIQSMLRPPDVCIV